MTRERSRCDPEPRLLDLYCCAGGAGVGYARAGFDVVGVDVRPQPRYPFEFHMADALEFVTERGGEFDAVHASPPCQIHTTMSNRWRGTGGRADSHEDLIGSTREALLRLGVPYVIENVPGAKRHLRAPIMLSGGHFGLGVERKRYFESNVLLLAPLSAAVRNPVGVYGKLDGRLLFRRADGSEQRAARNAVEAGAAMGIDWMEPRELAEAIPPAYTEFIGRQLLAAVSRESKQ